MGAKPAETMWVYIVSVTGRFFLPQKICYSEDLEK
jgi:hypothetical protein